MSFDVTLGVCFVFEMCRKFPEDIIKDYKNNTRPWSVCTHANRIHFKYLNTTSLHVKSKGSLLKVPKFNTQASSTPAQKHRDAHDFGRFIEV